MAKIDISKVAEILKKNQLDPALLRRVVEELNLAAQPDKAEGDDAPPLKKQWAIVVSDPEGRLPKDDFAGWVVQIPESESVMSALERVHAAAYDFLQTRKGRLNPIKTIGEAMESVPAKFFKEKDVWVKTKVPVFVIKTNNEIPLEKVGRRKDD